MEEIINAYERICQCADSEFSKARSWYDFHEAVARMIDPVDRLFKQEFHEFGKSGTIRKIHENYLADKLAKFKEKKEGPLPAAKPFVSTKKPEGPGFSDIRTLVPPMPPIPQAKSFKK